MTDNSPTPEQIQDLFEAIASKAASQIQQGIKDGPGNSYWDNIKKGRTEFGHCVAVPIIPFDTAAELEEFFANGSFPESMGGKFGMCFIDNTCIDEFIAHTGVDMKREQIEEAVSSILDTTDRTYEQAIMPLAIMKKVGFADGRMLCSCVTGKVDWWDTEAETIPYPGITKAKVKGYLQQSPQLLVTLSTRNPLQAGKNLNAWLDACRDLSLSVMIDSETRAGVSKLSKRNAADVLTIPVSPQKQAQGF